MNSDAWTVRFAELLGELEDDEKVSAKAKAEILKRVIDLATMQLEEVAQ